MSPFINICVKIAAISFVFAQLTSTDTAYITFSEGSRPEEAQKYFDKLARFAHPLDSNSTNDDGTGTDLLDTLKQKCLEKTGSDELYEEASATVEFCLFGIMSEVQEELERSQNMNIDNTFNEYCKRRNDALSCVENFAAAIDPCLTLTEKALRTLILNMTSSLLEFTCLNGNEVLDYIFEEAPECLDSRKLQLLMCANDAFGKYLTGDLPSFELSEENCVDIDKLQTCAVRELGQCKSNTTAALVDGVFEFLLKGTTCKSGASILSANMFLGLLIMAFVSKFNFLY